MLSGSYASPASMMPPAVVKPPEGQNPTMTLTACICPRVVMQQTEPAFRRSGTGFAARSACMQKHNSAPLASQSFCCTFGASSLHTRGGAPPLASTLLLSGEAALLGDDFSVARAFFRRKCTNTVQLPSSRHVFLGLAVFAHGIRAICCGQCQTPVKNVRTLC